MQLSATNGLGLSLLDTTLSPSFQDINRDETGNSPRLELNQLYAHARSRRQTASSLSLDSEGDSSLPALVADSSSGPSSNDSGSESDCMLSGVKDCYTPLARVLSSPLAEKRSQATSNSASSTDSASSDEDRVPSWRRGRPLSSLTPRVLSGGRLLGLRGVCMSQEGDRYTSPVTFNHRRTNTVLARPTSSPSPANLGRGLPRRPTVNMISTSSRSSSDESWGSSGTTVLRSTSSPSPPDSPIPVVAIELTVTPPTPKMKNNLLLHDEKGSGRVHSVSLRASVAPPPQEAHRYPTSSARYYAHTLSLNPPPFDVAPGRNIKLHDRIQHERNHLQLLLDAQQAIQQRLQEQQANDTKEPVHRPMRVLSESSSTLAFPRAGRSSRASTSPTPGTRFFSTLVPGTPRLPSSGASNSLPRRVPSQLLRRPMAPSSSESSASSDEDDFTVRSMCERVHNSLPTNRLGALRTLVLAASSSSGDSASSDEDSTGSQRRRLARAHMLQRLGQRATRTA